MQQDTLTDILATPLLSKDSIDVLIKNAVDSALIGNDFSTLPYLVQVLDTVIWPVVTLVVLWSFKKEFANIFDRAKSINVGGSSGITVETFSALIEETGSLAGQIAPQGQSKSFAPPPDPFGPSDPKMIVAQVRIDLETKLRKEGAKAQIAGSKDISIDHLVQRLIAVNTLKDSEAKVVNGLLKLTDNVMAGYDVTAEQARQIQDIFNKLK